MRSFAKVMFKTIADMASALSFWAGAGRAKRYYPLKLYNTLSGNKQEFVPLSARTVKMYNCGPTVYGRQHIGNLSMFVFTDIVRRTLEYNGYAVRQVINFTDVGHLVSDQDEGEDKMTKGLKREGMELSLENMRRLGEKYAQLFLDDLEKLNIKTEGTQFPRASDYIAAQIAMVQTLEEKGYAYVGKKGVYFDTSRFPDYGKLGNIHLEGLREGARVESAGEKKNPTDFLLWKFDLPAGRTHKKMGWDSPWGRGFPGWHIECSAMSHSLLGDQLDIHTGGVEHIPVHHNNEIAQSEAALGKKPFARFWLHRAHLQIEGAKIAKSEGNTIYLSEIIERGVSPLSFRYLLLGSHYSSSASFSWDALKAAEVSLYRLYNFYERFQEAAQQSLRGESASSYKTKFLERINDDLDTAGALAVVWELTKDPDVSASKKIKALDSFDEVLGLGLGSETSRVAIGSLEDGMQQLIDEREKARAAKEWKKADELRDKIESRGYTLEDASDGPRILKK